MSRLPGSGEPKARAGTPRTVRHVHRPRGGESRAPESAPEKVMEGERFPPLAVSRTTQDGRGPPGRASHAELSSFLERLRPDPRGGFLTLRALVLSLGPDVAERFENSDLVYTRRDRTFLVVRATKQHLTATFPPGFALPDPNGRLLRRGGESYVPIDSPDTLDGHVQEFMRRAYAAARPL